MWKMLPAASDPVRAARTAFPGFAREVMVKWNQQSQFVVEPTPYGRVELVRVDRGYVVAAEGPPQPTIDPQSLPDHLRRHFEDKRLVPWRLVRCSDPAEAIRALGAAPAEQKPLIEQAANPCLCSLDPTVELVGESRRRCAERLAGVAAAQQFPGPVALLTGSPDGIGKRTVAATVARRNHWRLVGELPLGRLAIPRVLQHPLENMLDTIVAVAAHCRPDDLLVVSDCELLRRLERRTRAMLLRELARMPHVVLVSRIRTDQLNGVASFACPALENAQDAKALVSAEHGDVVFAGSSFELLTRAAQSAGKGIIPGRLLYLVRLAKVMLNGQSVGFASGLPEELPDPDCRHRRRAGQAAPQVTLAPDEVTAAIEIAREAWTGEMHKHC